MSNVVYLMENLKLVFENMVYFFGLILNLLMIYGDEIF